MTSDIANIIKDIIIAKNFGFVDKITGKVRPVTIITQGENSNSVRKIFPIACGVSDADCQKGKYDDYVPNSTKKSVIYFEDNGGASFKGRDNRYYHYEASLRMIVWLNLKKLGKTDCDYSSKVAANIIPILPWQPVNKGDFQLLKVKDARMPDQSAALFSKYTYDEAVNQFLLYPYDYFALDILVEFSINANCIPAIDITAENTCE